MPVVVLGTGASDGASSSDEEQPDNISAATIAVVATKATRRKENESVFIYL